jgi:arylsulfatase A-like enzyme
VGKVNRRRGWSAFNRVGPAEETFEDYKVLDEITTEAEGFIARHAEAARDGQPFFLYYATTSPHTPTSPSPAFEGTSRIGLYGDFVRETDACIGRVVDALAEHGLDDNTLVIVTSDHGPASYAGNIRVATVNNLKELEKLGHYATGLYRGYKFSVYEGGLRVPYIVRWPGVVEAGVTCDRLIGLNDLIATLADITGYAFKAGEAPDSISYLPLLKDARAEAPRRSLIMESTRNFVIREGRWKLALTPGSGTNGTWGQEPDEAAWKRALDAFGERPTLEQLLAAPFVQLFDMEADPGERHNLASSRPEIVSRLAERLSDDIARGRSTPGEPLKNDKNVNLHARTPEFVLPRR